LTRSGFAAAPDSAAMNGARGEFQVLGLAEFTPRFAALRWQRERNRVCVTHVALMVLAARSWAGVEVTVNR
jgi:hypothetical protein